MARFARVPDLYDPLAGVPELSAEVLEVLASRDFQIFIGKPSQLVPH